MTTNNLWYSDQSTWQQASLAYAYDSTNASPGLITGYWKRVRKISVYKSGSWQEVVTYPSFEQILALLGTASSGGEPEATLFNRLSTAENLVTSITAAHLVLLIQLLS